MATSSNERVSAPKRKMEEIYQCVICLVVPDGRVYQVQIQLVVKQNGLTY